MFSISNGIIGLIYCVICLINGTLRLHDGMNFCLTKDPMIGLVGQLAGCEPQVALQRFPINGLVGQLAARQPQIAFLVGYRWIDDLVALIG